LLARPFAAIDATSNRKEKNMSLLTKEQAADLMDVPVPWVDALLELGALEGHIGPDGKTLIDADEILAKRLAATRREAASLTHVREMLKRLGVVRPAAKG
jgi:hypothetical protein